MLTVDEIRNFMDSDAANEQKRLARVGVRYFNAEHDIRNSRIFFVNDDGILQEDKWKSNVKISHPFFTELVEQCTQYMLSVEDGFIRSDLPELQSELDAYFNENEDFYSALYELITGAQVKGCEYLYAYKDGDGKTAFKCADSLNVVEVKAREASDNADHIIYWYTDKTCGGEKTITRIQVWDEESTYYYMQDDHGEIVPDPEEKPRPHTLYMDEKSGRTYSDSFGMIPFFPLENNKNRTSSLKPIKDIIDDYDVMNCGLSNSLVDFDHPLYVVQGFDGNDLDELMLNIRGKKIMGTPENAKVEIKTIDIPYQARQTKMELDEKNIFRFGFGMNTEGLRDTTATTNIAIKTAYLNLDLKSYRIGIYLKKFMRRLLRLVLREINAKNGMDYRQKDVYFVFERHLPTNELENAQVKQAEAQTRQVEINTILNLQTVIDDETRLQLIAEQLDVDYGELRDKAPKPEDDPMMQAEAALNAIPEEGAVM